MLESLDGYISGQLMCSFCAGICTDGASTLTGRLSGLVARIKEVAPESIFALFHLQGNAGN